MRSKELLLSYVSFYADREILLNLYILNINLSEFIPFRRYSKNVPQNEIEPNNSANVICRAQFNLVQLCLHYTTYFDAYIERSA